MVENLQNNYAFIDAQNLYRSLSDGGWKLDYFKFRRYLSKRFGVKRAIVYIGKHPKYSNMRTMLRRAGFILELKEAIPYWDKNGEIQFKANVDIDLSVGTLGRYYNDYNKAIIVSGDGDYLPLYKYLQEIGKLGEIILPDREHGSKLIEENGLKPFTVVLTDPSEKAELLIS